MVASLETVLGAAVGVYRFLRRRNGRRDFLHDQRAHWSRDDRLTAHETEAHGKAQ